MANKGTHLFIGRSHRYLVVILGIQFLLLTIGGLYFSWKNIDEIHGDFQHKHSPLLTNFNYLVSPSTVFTTNTIKANSIESLQLITILKKHYYLINFLAAKQCKPIIADATTGTIKSTLTKDEAIHIAAKCFLVMGGYIVITGLLIFLF